MRPHALILALAASAAALPAAAQSYDQRYGQTYDRGRQTAPAQSYDRQTYPSSAYDRSSPQGYAPQPRYDSDRDPSATSRYADPGYERGQPSRGGYDGAQEQEPDLRRELSLRRDQYAALDAYRAAFRFDEAATRRAEDTARRLPSMTTPQRLDFSRSEMERERADFERTDAATRRFYAQLDARQRQTFDRLTAPQPETDDEREDRPTPGAPTGPR